MYTDRTGQLWDCREEYSLTEGRAESDRRAARRLAQFGAGAIAAVRVEHESIVTAQRWAIGQALAGNPPQGQAGRRNPRRIVAEVCREFAPRITALAMREEMRGDGLIGEGAGAARRRTT